jgi:GNAT superfamily N-acetyltransferase
VRTLGTTEMPAIRSLEARDAEAAIAIDARITGRRRDRYLGPKIEEALARGGIRSSLAAEVDGAFVGFLLAKVAYGEFGALEPVAVLDTLGVHPDFRGRGVGAALLDQLRSNLAALGIRRLRTEVAWDDPTLLSFFHHEGFVPAPRLVLEADPDAADARARRDLRRAPPDLP